MEVCAIVNRAFEVENTTILPEMEVVGDGFISLIGWQTQGHKLVPIFYFPAQTAVFPVVI